MFSAIPSLSDDGSFRRDSSFTNSNKILGLFTLEAIAIFGNSLLPISPGFPSLEPL